MGSGSQVPTDWPSSLAQCPLVTAGFSRIRLEMTFVCFSAAVL